MNTVFALAMLIFTAADDPETSDLIQRLGSARAADRDAASATLEAKGRARCQRSGAASRESRDAEVRSRATKLLAAIEHDVLTRPTMVTLDVRDRTIGEVIKAIGEKNHFDLTGELDGVREKLLREVTIHEETRSRSLRRSTGFAPGRAMLRIRSRTRRSLRRSSSSRTRWPSRRPGSWGPRRIPVRSG